MGRGRKKRTYVQPQISLIWQIFGQAPPKPTVAKYVDRVPRCLSRLLDFFFQFWDAKSMHQNLLQYFHISDLTYDQQQTFINGVNDVANQVVTTTILKQLSPSEREEFLSLLEKPSDSGSTLWLDYIHKKVPDIETHIQIELKKALRQMKLGF